MLSHSMALLFLVLSHFLLGAPATNSPQDRQIWWETNSNIPGMNSIGALLEKGEMVESTLGLGMFCVFLTYFVALDISLVSGLQMLNVRLYKLQTRVQEHPDAFILWIILLLWEMRAVSSLLTH